jgi:predicted amino acid racemase
MISQAGRVVANAGVSLNTELDVIERLSASAVTQGLVHGVVLMVELGDLREGILPGDLHDVARSVLRLPGIVLRGLGTNLACQSGVVPDATNMAELSTLATSVETTFGIHLDIVSGGNSANLDWALDPSTDVGRVNHLRLGESILLGLEPLHRVPVPGLRVDAFTLVAEVIESRIKPSEPWGLLGQTAFGETLDRPPSTGDRAQVIVALGRQDVDPDGVTPPPGYTVLGASSDHLVLDAGTHRPSVGDELRFGLNYSALVRAMTSPFVSRRLLGSPIC